MSYATLIFSITQAVMCASVIYLVLQLPPELNPTKEGTETGMIQAARRQFLSRLLHRAIAVLFVLVVVLGAVQTRFYRAG